MSAAMLLTGTLLAARPGARQWRGDRIAQQRELLSSDQNIPLIASDNV